MNAKSRTADANVLKAGYAKVDITPDEPVYLCGYNLREAPASKVASPLYARALAFDDGRRKFLVMMADMIGVDGAGLAQQIAQATGLEIGDIFAGDVHNHAAPISRPAGQPGQNNDHTRWIKRFPQAVVEVAKQALADLQPVVLGVGKGQSRIAINRRRPSPGGESFITFDENHASQSFGKWKTDQPTLVRELEGVIRLGPNPAGPIDPEVTVLRIDRPDGSPLAMLANYGCHGTCLGGRNDTICGDWIGHALGLLEKQLGGGAMFLQGASGDINPRVVGGLDGQIDSLDTVASLGEEFAREAARVWALIAPRPVTSPIRSVSKTVLLPRCYRELMADFHQTVIEAPTTAVRVGDCTWINFPGEIFHQIGLDLKAASPTPALLLASCTNGMIGYFPTPQAYSEGGYEPATTRLDPQAQQHYLRAVLPMLAELA